MSRMSTLASCVCVGLIYMFGTAGLAGIQSQHDCKPSGPHTSANPPCSKDSVKNSNTAPANKPVYQHSDSGVKTADETVDIKKTSTKDSKKAADKTSDSPKKSSGKTAEASEKTASKMEQKPQ